MPFESIYFRPLRTLLHDGKPPNDVIVLTVEDRKAENKPVAILSKANRLVLWPLLPPNCTFESSKPANSIDHVTLDPSGKMHVTYFDASDTRKHASNGWVSQSMSDSGLRFWLKYFVQWDVVEKQAMEEDVRVKIPSSDAQRRINKFAEFGRKMRHVSLPADRNEFGNFLRIHFFVVEDESKGIQPTQDIIDECCSDFEYLTDVDNVKIQLIPTLVCVGNSKLLVVTSCPRATCGDHVLLGFPRSK